LLMLYPQKLIGRCGGHDAKQVVVVVSSSSSITNMRVVTLSLSLLVLNMV
jgi:hypothetical protein